MNLANFVLIKVNDASLEVKPNSDVCVREQLMRDGVSGEVAFQSDVTHNSTPYK